MPLQSKEENSNKRQENRLTRFILPGFLAVIIHLSFFGFKTATPPENPNALKPKRVMFLPQNTIIPEEQNLLTWMEMLDPTHFIVPNRKYGFSRTYNPKEIDDIPLKLEDQNLLQSQKEGLLPVPWKPRFETIREIWPYTPEDIKCFDTSKFRKNLDFPIWMSETTVILPQMFGNLDNLKDMLKKSPPEFQETVLKVNFFGPNFFPKVEIVNSCGNNDLDILALKTLTVKSKILAINDKGSNEPYFITVKWYSKD